MIIVADAGPLMALAKVNGLEALFRLFPKVLTPPAVYSEVVTEGLRLGAPDAAALDLHYKNKALEVVALKEPVLSLTTRLGWGEEESIRLAIEARADWLLIDDLDARRAAPASFQSAGTETQIKGTLGIVVSAHQDAGLSKDKAISLVQALSERPDVWGQRRSLQPRDRNLGSVGWVTAPSSRTDINSSKPTRRSRGSRIRRFIATPETAPSLRVWAD